MNEIVFMCLALPGQVIEHDGFFAVVRIGPVRKKVLNAANAQIGQWVLIENEIASEKLSSEEQKAMALVWNQTARKKKKTKKK